MKQVSAAVGVLRRGEEVFVQRRPPASAHYPGYWEFPGGKIEAGETPAQALARELQEEIGIHTEEITPWLTREHGYAHARVTLHVYQVLRWRGTPAGREGQQQQWRRLRDKPPQLLPANDLLWKWLTLPPLCVVSAAEIIGAEQTLALLPQVTAAPLLLQLRDKNLPASARRRLAMAMAASLPAGGLLVINDDEALAREAGAGLHLSSRRLMQCGARPPFEWVGASCHSAAELAQAQALGLDYAALSPVSKTLTHVQAPPLGWDGFAALAQTSSLPLYALGGLTAADLAQARRHGAHGVAMMRRGWQAADAP